MLLAAKEKVLFIGDSITDMGRRDAHAPLGIGYVFMAASLTDGRCAELELTYHNRGMGGNNVLSLRDRWQEDCIDLQCQWVSILVGINDAHGYVSGAEDFSPQNYEKVYRDLLRAVVDQTPGRLILWEPFYLRAKGAGQPAVADVIDRYVAAVNRLGEEFADRLVGVIHTQDLFARAAQRRWIEFWMPDGVHPTPAGHALMACEFLKLMGCSIQ